jgi:hypothetical protein
VAWRTTPPPLPVLYTRQWLRHDGSHSEVMMAVEQLNKASRKAAVHQKVLLVDVAMMVKGQYPQSYLRPTSPPSGEKPYRVYLGLPFSPPCPIPGAGPVAAGYRRSISRLAQASCVVHHTSARSRDIV